MVPVNTLLRSCVPRPYWAAFSHPTENQFLQVEIDKRGNKESAVLARSPAHIESRRGPYCSFQLYQQIRPARFHLQGHNIPLHPMPPPCLICARKKERTFSIMILCRRRELL
ncbi:hypothetical protein TNCT_285821 [Trichonephila clavata]|uniref:Uncharacterized protein n=1 Tax=Trichonephila clavata TaxID=2740835 RepID=A0A8X6LTW0_TRICU|nr:hypothetical protein TNCT_285821 [Trichonephila clavata]